MIVYGLPHCSTTKKAVAMLEEKHHSVTLIDYREHPISRSDLAQYIQRAGVPIQKWFNTSGQAYRAQKEALHSLPLERLIDRLAAEPMLLKRPIVVSDDQVIVGISKAGY